MGFIHTLYYYQVQKSLDDARKEKEKKKEEERQRRPIDYKNSNSIPRYSHDRLGDHSPSSIVEQRKMRERNREEGNYTSSHSDFSNVDDVDIEEAFEDGLMGG